MSSSNSSQPGRAALALGALGVVYGDIGTSPLYTIKEVFAPSHDLGTDATNVLGILSLIAWSLMIVVSIKYVTFIMRADNRGEGGIMAMIALTQRVLHAYPKSQRFFLLLGLMGAALFLGDGMITPAISVLSAVEGLGVISPQLNNFEVPITLVLITMLFAVQRRGTASVASMFGPIMMVWFSFLGITGMLEIIHQPQVFAALNPAYAIGFVHTHGMASFIIFGAVVLAITGAEALYADMGHFGRSPIRQAWFGLVLPSLTLNYFGQGALLLRDPSAIDNPFYHMIPAWAVLPTVVLATLATIIASQAVITGLFSITKQAIQLNFAPRMTILQTSEHSVGQIYVPAINGILFAGVVLLVLVFQNSNGLAAAYGITVTGTMLIDSLLLAVVATLKWRWPFAPVLLMTIGFLSLDTVFFGSNILKFFDGGWFPVLVATVVFILMITWNRGRTLLFARMEENSIDINGFLNSISQRPPQRVAGTAVFLMAKIEGVPHSLLHNLAHNKVLHERVILLNVTIHDTPFVPVDQRIEHTELPMNFHKVVLHFGFKDDPNVPEALSLLTKDGIVLERMQTSYFLSRQTLLPAANPGMALWRERLFISMARNAAGATGFFHLPTNRVVEIGTQIEL
ncbi:MAG: potassium transporter Kup [Pseudomonadota bacterium]